MGIRNSWDYCEKFSVHGKFTWFYIEKWTMKCAVAIGVYILESTAISKQRLCLCCMQMAGRCKTRCFSTLDSSGVRKGCHSPALRRGWPWSRPLRLCFTFARSLAAHRLGRRRFCPSWRSATLLNTLSTHSKRVEAFARPEEHSCCVATTSGSIFCAVGLRKRASKDAHVKPTTSKAYRDLN